MNKALLILVFIFSIISVHAQDDRIPPPPPAVDSDSSAIFVKVEVEATFPGGKSAWVKFLQANLNADAVAKKAAPKKAKNWEQTAYARFLIDRDGSIIDVTVTNESMLHPEVVKETRRVILLSPKWKPGYQNGKPVRSYRTQPLTFSVSE